MQAQTKSVDHVRDQAFEDMLRGKQSADGTNANRAVHRDGASGSTQAQTQTIDDILDAMHRGTASVKAPKDAKEYESFAVTLTLSGKDLETFTREEPPDADSISKTVGNVRMSKKMTAEIIAPDFVIESKSAQDQIVTENEDTVWTWTIHSESFGPEKIIVRLAVLVKLPGDTTDTPRIIPVAELPIRVNLSPLGWTEHHWEWLATALVIPLIGWLYSRFSGGGNEPQVPPRRFARKRP